MKIPFYGHPSLRRLLPTGFTFLLLAQAACPQGTMPVPSIPMEGRIIAYRQTIPLHLSPGETGSLFRNPFFRAVSWLSSTFPTLRDSIRIYPDSGNVSDNQGQTGRLSGKGICKITTGNNGNYYLLCFDIEVSVTDSNCLIRTANYYEKPVESGITNDYSKIEYRWWDFRQGHPWSKEDRQLFAGLDSSTISLLDSFGRTMCLPRFNDRHSPPGIIAFYSNRVEPDHVDFAYDAIRFLKELAARRQIRFDTTSNWDNTNEVCLKNYQLVCWLNEFPHNEEQRAAFQKYIEQGGGWLGFHVAGYNDRDTKWPWFLQFFGGAVFYNNNWPPLRARLIVEDTLHPVTLGLPARYTAPINEWYGWRPSPRDNKDVKVLVSLDPANYPLGKKDIIRSGDIPVVWTNTRYRMLYLNMGHGDKILTDRTQNILFENAVLWLLQSSDSRK